MNTDTKQFDPCKVVTGECRLSFCHLTQPHANPMTPGARAKYSLTALIPKGDTATKQRIDAAILAAIGEATAKKWNNARPQQVPVPIHDGDGLKQDGTPFGPECRGCWVMTASTNTRPGIVDAALQPVLNDLEVYSGMYGRVSIRFFGYATADKKGIGAGLGNVQKTRDGEPLGNRSTPHEDFGGGCAQQQYAWQYPGYGICRQPGVPGYGQAINPVTGMPMA